MGQTQGPTLEVYDLVYDLEVYEKCMILDIKICNRNFMLLLFASLSGL